MYENALFTIDTDDDKVKSKCKALDKQVADMNVARTGARAVNHNGFIYVIGGDTGNGHTTTGEFYDPEANIWNYIPEMKYARSEFRLAVAHNRIIVVGGYIGNSPTDVVEMYDIATKTWVECEQLAEPRANVSMAKVEFLDPEVTKKIKFRGDVLIEKTRRIALPIEKHFQWK